MLSGTNAHTNSTHNKIDILSTEEPQLPVKSIILTNWDTSHVNRWVQLGSGQLAILSNKVLSALIKGTIEGQAAIEAHHDFVSRHASLTNVVNRFYTLVYKQKVPPRRLWARFGDSTWTICRKQAVWRWKNSSISQLWTSLYHSVQVPTSLSPSFPCQQWSSSLPQDLCSTSQHPSHGLQVETHVWWVPIAGRNTSAPNTSGQKWRNVRIGACCACW